MANERFRFTAGDLNPMNTTPNGVRLPETYTDTASTPQQISYILGKQLENDARSRIDRWPAKAIVLSVSTTYCIGAGTTFLGMPIATKLEKPVRRIFVKAHIPEIHGAIPLPKKFAKLKHMSVADRMRVGMHPTFVGEKAVSGRNDMSGIPAVGDIVLVDYDNRGKLLGGIYIGLLEEGTGAISDENSPSFSGKNFFDQVQARANKPIGKRNYRERLLNADYYQHPMTLADYKT